MGAIIDKVAKCDLTEEEINAEEERNKNYNFVQLYRHNMQAMRKLIREDQTAAEILIFLMEHMTTENAVCCSQSVLQEITGKGRTSVYKAIKTLDEEDYICIFKSGTSNVYILNPEVAWTRGKTGKKFCQFKGRIILSESENKDIERKIKKLRTSNLMIQTPD